MKSNYYIFILIVSIILFRSSLLNLVNNITSYLFINDNQFEVNLLREQNQSLNNQISELLYFKNNIRIEHNYIITNAVRNNYGFNRLIINGSNYTVGDEVVNIHGLIGIISTVGVTTSEVTLLQDSNIVVSINDENGKISHQDEVGNLIINEISNYNNIRLNDPVYSTMGTYIGRVIRIRYGAINHYVTVQRASNNDLNFLAVIQR